MTVTNYLCICINLNNIINVRVSVCKYSLDVIYDSRLLTSVSPLFIHWLIFASSDFDADHAFFVFEFSSSVLSSSAALVE